MICKFEDFLFLWHKSFAWSKNKSLARRYWQIGVLVRDLKTREISLRNIVLSYYLGKPVTLPLFLGHPVTTFAQDVQKLFITPGHHQHVNQMTFLETRQMWSCNDLHYAKSLNLKVGKQMLILDYHTIDNGSSLLFFWMRLLKDFFLGCLWDLVYLSFS